MPEYNDSKYIINAWSEGFTVRRIAKQSKESSFFAKHSVRSINLEPFNVNSYSIVIAVHKDDYLYRGSKYEDIDPKAYDFIMKHTFGYNEESKEEVNNLLYS